MSEPPEMVSVQQLRDRLNELARKHERRQKAVAADLKRIESAPRLLYETELLKAARAKPFDAFVEVIDYGVSPPQPLRIDLEPGRPLQEQVQKRFKLARRLLAAEAKALERLSEIEAERKKLEGIAREIETIAERGASEAALVAFNAAHADLFGVKKRGVKGGAPRDELPYREYWSQSGRAIWVGKNARKNDLLTFKHASPHAQWLHASGCAGSHVVVQKRRDEVLDPQTLEDAARLAAHFSKAPAGGAVEVSVTEVKFVRRFRGGNPGQVQIQRETHRLVENDPVVAKGIEQRKKPE